MCCTENSFSQDDTFVGFSQYKGGKWQPNNNVKGGVDGPFVVSFTVPLCLMVSGFTFGEAGLFMKYVIAVFC